MDDLVTRLKWAEVCGLKYMPNNAFIVISLNKEHIPLFGKLTDIILVNSSTILLVVVVYNTVQYSENLFSYTVTPTHNMNVLNVKTLKYPQVIHSCKIQQLDHISLSYYLC